MSASEQGLGTPFGERTDQGQRVFRGQVRGGRTHHSTVLVLFHHLSLDLHSLRNLHFARYAPLLHLAHLALSGTTPVPTQRGLDHASGLHRPKGALSTVQRTYSSRWAPFKPLISAREATRPPFKTRQTRLISSAMRQNPGNRPRSSRRPSPVLVIDFQTLPTPLPSCSCSIPECEGRWLSADSAAST